MALVRVAADQPVLLAVAAFPHMPFIVGAAPIVAVICERPRTREWLGRFFARLGRSEAVSLVMNAA